MRPGRGTIRARLGMRLMTTSGSARPSPRARKIMMPGIGGPARAAATAAPMKGAVHGVATTAAKTPVKKLPATPPRAARLCPAPAQRPPITSTPEKLSPTAKSSQIIASTNSGDWNWKPQPASRPPSRRASNTPPRARKLSSTPAP